MTETTCDCATAPETVDLTALAPVLDRHAHDEGGLIVVLQETQALFGHLPKDALRAIAEARHTPLAEVFGVATFYTQFHLSPRGKTIVRICSGTACHVAGAPEVIRAVCDELNAELGKTTDDLRFTIEAVACVGCCGLAPVAVVGEQPHGQLDAPKARKLAKQLLRTAPR